MEGDILMVPVRKYQCILYVSKNSIRFYDPTYNTVFSIPGIENCIKDLEIINIQQLDTAIKSFVEANKLVSAYLLILLASDALFEKNTQGVMGSQNDQHEEATQQFLDNVPFENVAVRIFQLDGKMLHIVATNRDLIDALANSFEKEGFVPSYVLPEYALGQPIPNFDLSAAILTLKKLDSIKGFGIVTEDKPVQQKTEKTTTASQVKKESPKNTRQWILIGVFVVMLIVLGIVLYTSMNSS